MAGMPPEHRRTLCLAELEHQVQAMAARSTRPGHQPSCPHRPQNGVDLRAAAHVRLLARPFNSRQGFAEMGHLSGYTPWSTLVIASRPYPPFEYAFE